MYRINSKKFKHIILFVNKKITQSQFLQRYVAKQHIVQYRDNNTGTSDSVFIANVRQVDCRIYSSRMLLVLCKTYLRITTATYANGLTHTMLYLNLKMLLYMCYIVFLEIVSSSVLSETSTSRILRRLDRLEDDVSMIRNDIIEDLRVELRHLRKDLKEERKLRREDISTLSKILTESSGQVVKHKHEEVSEVKQGPCNCGAILSQYEHVMNAFKKEKSENIMLRKAFNEMSKQHP